VVDSGRHYADKASWRGTETRGGHHTLDQKKWVDRMINPLPTVLERTGLVWRGRSHQRLREKFRDDVYWQSQPEGVARAVAIGLFLVFLPLPVKSLVGVIACVSFRANIPIMLVLVWINNPLTYVPICILSYKLGQLLLLPGMAPARSPVSTAELFHGNFNSLNMQSFVEILQPLMLGATVAGFALGLSAYFLTHLVWRLAKPTS